MRLWLPWWALALLTASLLLSCVQDKAEIARPTVEKDMYDRDLEVFLPESLWSRLEDSYNLLEQDRKSLPPAKKRSFHGFTVQLLEVKEHPLRGKNFTLRFGGRGGFLDLAEFVTGKSGHFRIRIEPAEWEKFALKKVYYMSHAKKRNWRNETIGAGCENFMDITSFFQTSWNKEGAESFLGDQHYASVWSGTYFFVGANEGELALAQITITDSRYPELYCRQPTEKP